MPKILNEAIPFQQKDRLHCSISFHYDHGLFQLPGERNFTARKLLVIWTNALGHVFSWSVGLWSWNLSQFGFQSSAQSGVLSQGLYLFNKFEAAKVFHLLGLLSTHVCMSRLLTLGPNIKCMYPLTQKFHF